ncbi:hypothetical protein TRVA0_011S02212 [Trichomonascus vanleenenianus]|uniref:Rqc1p n=1 Tax=Trichomonascus vanleenenianus TaxID=2268995 RepID=UPI003EC98252
MSARAVKKLYGDPLLGRTNDEDHESSAEESEEEVVTRAKPNPFALLNDDSDEEEEEEYEEPKNAAAEVEKPIAKEESPAPKSKKKKKKAKKKSKKEEKTKPEEDIDNLIASVKKSDISTAQSDEHLKFVAVDTKKLDYEREMRQLFGKQAIEQQQLRGDFGGRDGRTIPGTARKLVFAKIRASFPPVAKRFILMEELKDDMPQGLKAFKFVFTGEYTQSQLLYQEGMLLGDLQALINRVMPINPYHIGTLLLTAASMIQAGQRPEAVELIERCLVAFDRALRSSFTFDGTSRLPFKYYENRQFYLSVFRYIQVLMQRNTWETAFEYAKLLWSLDLENDPYCVGAMIDFFALKNNELDYVIDVTAPSGYYMNNAPYKNRPNLYYSRALAIYLKLSDSGKTDDEIKADAELLRSLTEAVTKFPHVASRLLDNAVLDEYCGGEEMLHVSESQAILTEMYLLQLQKAWKESPVLRMLLRVATGDIAIKPVSDGVVVDDVVRYALLSEQKEVLKYIPKRYFESPQMADDLVPPSNDHTSNSGERYDYMFEQLIANALD